MTIDFGWVLPYGEKRTPKKASNYLPHVKQFIPKMQSRFHSLWMPDHFMNSQNDVLEAMTTLSFLAGSIPDMKLGTIVLGQNYRNPALLAKMATTLQTLSDGRFILGIGAGWKEEEYLAYDYKFPPAPDRITQMAETIQICRAMWDPDQPEASFQGEFYQIQSAICYPKPYPPPPIMVGGGGEKLTLRVVAEHADWWNLPGASPSQFARKLDILAEHCAAVGRDPGDIRKTWMGVVSIAPTRGQAEANMADYPIWTGDVPLVGTPEEVRTQLQAYIDLGVDAFILAFADEPETAGISLFASEVIPYWNKE